MQESCTYGSVRGARGNSRPYRDEAISGVSVPACRGAHAGYDVSSRLNAKTRGAWLRAGFERDKSL